MMDGRGESTVEGINILERERELRWNLEARGHAHVTGAALGERKKGGRSCSEFCFWGQFFFFSGIVLLLLHSV